MASKTTSSHYVDQTMKIKKDFAIAYFKLTHMNESVNENELLSTVLEQIEVCEGLYCPLSVETIMDWICNKTVREIEREAHTIKFAA